MSKSKPQGLVYVQQSSRQYTICVLLNSTRQRDCSSVLQQQASSYPFFWTGRSSSAFLTEHQDYMTNKKFNQRCAGPYKILETLGLMPFVLRNLKMQNVFLVSLLKSYNPPFIWGWCQPPLSPILTEDEPEYKVKNVLTSWSSNPQKTRLSIL